MSSYIASNDNRLYAAIEAAYGRVPEMDSGNRFPAVRFSAKQAIETSTRRDKTGTRTFLGAPTGTRRNTDYQLKTYLSSWSSQTEQPGYGPLFQAALGGDPQIHGGGTIASANSETRLTFQGGHGLTAGQAIATGGELRFVSAVVDGQTIEINAPFSGFVGAGSIATPTVTYRPAKSLPSFSVLDCWSPDAAVQRVLCGGAVDEFSMIVNSDFHEFTFNGPGRDLIDSASFTDGQGELSAFPPEPAPGAFDHSVVPGHLGQVWIGVTPERLYTLTSATLTLSNAIETRAKEFGLDGLRAITPGQRKVSLDFELFATADEQSAALYAAARQRSPMSVMFQLGQQEQQLFGVYLKSVVPELPDFDDSETRLSWSFLNCRAQGSDDDEVVIAFG